MVHCVQGCLSSVKTGLRLTYFEALQVQGSAEFFLIASYSLLLLRKPVWVQSENPSELSI